MAYETMLIEKKNHVATVTFNRPDKFNALDMVMREELMSIVAELADDQDTKVLVLTGAGKAFCAGGDVATMKGVTAPAGRDRMKAFSTKFTRLIMNLEKPVIAAVNGVAAGAGFNIAIACDMIIASETARFAQSFTKIGLIPDLGGLYTLPLRVGVPRAKEIMMTARFVEAKEAAAIGLVNRVVPVDQVLPEAKKLAEQLAAGPGRAYAMIKAAFNLWPLNWQTVLELETDLQAVAFASRDFDEGRQAFIDKRKAEFTGE